MLYKKLRFLFIPFLLTFLSTSIFAAEILLGDTTICAGTEAQLEIVGDFATLQWTPEETLSCDNCPNPRATPSQTTTYTATFEEEGIISSLSITVEVFELQALPDLTICKGTEVVLDAGLTYTNANYTWSPASLFSCTDCPNPTILNSSTISSTQVVYGIDAMGCMLRDTFDLTILDQDGPLFSIIEDNTFCDSVDIGGIMDVNTTYSWSSEPTGFTSSLANPRVNPLVETTYYLEATTTGCAVTSMDSVTLIPVLPEPLALMDSIRICEGDSISISNVVPNSEIRYEWMPDLTLSDAMDPNPLAFPSSDQLYELTAYKGLCESKDTIEVLVTEIALDIMESDTAFVCLGNDQPLTVNSRPGTSSVQWTPATFLATTTGDNNTVIQPTENITYYLSITNGTCSLTDSIHVRVDSLPGVQEIMPQDTTVCQGEFVILRSPIFETTSYPLISYQWEPGEGAYQTGDSLYNVVVIPSDTTDYQRITTNGGCVDTAYVTVNIIPVDEIMVVPSDTTICVGESVQLQVTSPGLSDFVWMPPETLSCSDCDDPVAAPIATTEYMVAANDANGCPAMGGATVNIAPIPTLSLPTRTTICPGELVVLNSSIYPGGTYGWTSNDPAFTDVSNPTPSVSPAMTATYTAEITSPFCADVEESVTIEVIQPATLTASPDATICPNESITLNADASGAQGTLVWSTGEVGPSIVAAPFATTDYRVTFSNDCETLTAGTRVTVEDPFSVSIIPVPGSLEVNLGETIELNLNTLISSSEIAEILWTENGEPVGGSTETVAITPSIEGGNVYVVKVTTTQGCSAEGFITLFVIKPTVVIPNAFTPNQDGLNDELNIVEIVGNVVVNSFVIFDRWGNKVFDNPDGGWDGTFNGKPMPSDVYVLLVELGLPNGGSESLKGEVTLIR
ncbi:MAG: gliding motility-associated C-terminal domain-containing protein [Bacteroidia bacterium]|nr:gliding motility-associated C-terminal domain-containing protein [Bacteroidia bacterium]